MAAPWLGKFGGYILSFISEGVLGQSGEKTKRGVRAPASTHPRRGSWSHALNTHHLGLHGPPSFLEGAEPLPLFVICPNVPSWEERALGWHRRIATLSPGLLAVPR